MRPLNLPNSVATRIGASKSDDDVTSKSAHATQNSIGSLSSASDASSPTTSTFSLRSHSRFPSGSSSLTSSSTSPILEHGEILVSTSKLPMPKLPEEPAEHEEQAFEKKDNFEDSFDSYEFDADFSDRTTVLLRSSASYEFDADALEDISGTLRPRPLRKQPSLDTGFNKLSMRLNSFSQRWRSRTSSVVPAGLGIQTTDLAQPASSRSSSLTSAHFPGFDQNDMLPPTPAMSIRASTSTPVSPIDEYERPSIDEPFDRKALSSTPLLPPMMNAPQEDVTQHVQSPLQSPSIAASKTSSVIGSSETLQTSVLPSPPLSTKPSIASFHRGRSSTLASVTDVPPLHIEEIVDAWSFKLGHANFNIEPAPYVPEVFDAESHRQFVANWEQARQQFFKHRARTAEHYGASSKTYKLTEEKWQSIEADWKKNSAILTASLPPMNDDANLVVPEPAPLTNMPTLSDPRCDGKFPKLGDQDIVGPMERIERPLPVAQTTPPSPSAKITTFFKSMFNRSRSATR